MQRLNLKIIRYDEKVETQSCSAQYWRLNVYIFPAPGNFEFLQFFPVPGDFEILRVSVVLGNVFLYRETLSISGWWL